jgi:hypothetical protein
MRILRKSSGKREAGSLNSRTLEMNVEPPSQIEDSYPSTNYDIVKRFLRNLVDVEDRHPWGGSNGT